jgi:peptide/nickel transport system permease protein
MMAEALRAGPREAMETNDHDRVPSGLKRMLTRMWRLRLGMLGLLFVGILLLTAAFAPLVAPNDPFEQDIMNSLNPPAWMEDGSWDFPLGTDQVGRCILSRIIYGTRISLIVGICAVSIMVLIGTSLGMLAGFYGGVVDSIISFLINCMMGFPFILLAMSLVVVLGPSLKNLVIALGVTSWPVFARVARVETLKYKSQEFILAAHSLGYSSLRIIVRHILPNLATSLIVVGTVEVARAIIRESILSFLGLGVQPPTPSWGVMLSEGRGYMLIQWWLATFPGLAIFVSALGMNLIGDALRDLLDPHLRKT